MKFSIVANPKQPNMKKILTKVIGFLEDFDLEKETAKIVGLTGSPMNELQGDVVISLGGDGTILYILSKINKPIFGVNCGNIGFLTAVNEYDLSYRFLEWVKDIEEDNCIMEQHSRIDVKIGTPNTSRNTYPIATALNEVVLHTPRVGKLQGFLLHVGHRKLFTFHGDGVIIATPTGSTGYARSLGGPISPPNSNCNIVIPMAPSLIDGLKAPHLVPADCHIMAEVTLEQLGDKDLASQAPSINNKTRDPKSILVIDGQNEMLVKRGEVVHISPLKNQPR